MIPHAPDETRPDFEAEDWDDLPLEEKLLLDLDGYEGPIDVLLALARDQKLDLAEISILELADQYLRFIETARDLRLELAADYLVMASWLAWLKSRLLLPQDEATQEEPSATEMAEALAFQLKRLQALQEAAEELFARPRLGRDVFPRGQREQQGQIVIPVYEATLYELLSAYGAIQRRQSAQAAYRMEPFNLYSIEAAYERLRSMLGNVVGWVRLDQLLPDLQGGKSAQETRLQRRSALAAMLAASLEMTKEGQSRIRQEGLFGDIYLQAQKRVDTR